MTSIRNLLLTVPGCLFAFATFAQEGRVVIADTASREVRRSAHQIHIPVGQLKNAREALREATDLARKMDPPPYDQFNNLAQIWLQLNRTKAKGVIESFIQDMRDIAQKPEDAEAAVEKVVIELDGLGLL